MRRLAKCISSAPKQARPYRCYAVTTDTRFANHSRSVDPMIPDYAITVARDKDRLNLKKKLASLRPLRVIPCRVLLLKCFFVSIGRRPKECFSIFPLSEIQSPLSGFFSQWPVPGRLPHCQKVFAVGENVFGSSAEKHFIVLDLV